MMSVQIVWMLTMLYLRYNINLIQLPVIFSWLVISGSWYPPIIMIIISQVSQSLMTIAC